MARARRSNTQIMMKGLTRRVRPTARLMAKNKFDTAKRWLIGAVESHHVSEDIRSLGNSPILGAKGSLFGFMGFHKGDDPVGRLISFLEEEIKYQEAFTPPKGSLYSVSVVFPTKSQMVSGGIVTPWDQSQPWVSAIEHGISGLPHFLSKNAGNSGQGIQVKGTIRSSDFSGVSYLTPLIAKFRQRLLL